MKVSERQSVVDQLKEFLHAQSSQPLPDIVCQHCGEIMQYIDLACWLYQTDAGGTLRVPFCACEEAPSAVRLSNGAAARVA